MHRAARGCATAPRRRASSKTQKSESFDVARRCLQALPANHAKCHVLCNEKCYFAPTQGCARLRNSARTARQLQNAKKCDSFCVARRGLQALSASAASRRCLPALPPGAVPRGCLSRAQGPQGPLRTAFSRLYNKSCKMLWFVQPKVLFGACTR